MDRKDLITEKLTDAFWCERNAHQSVTGPERMIPVLEKVIAILREIPRHKDDVGACSWAALWLEEQLIADGNARKNGLL